MWWSRSKEKRASQDEDRLATLSRRLDDAESKLRTLPAEWQDTLDRIEHILGRINKRAHRERQAEGLVNGNGEQVEPPPDPIARILAIRRNRGG